MARGESADVIEADFVARFGSKVRRFRPRGRCPRASSRRSPVIAGAAGLIFWRVRARGAKAPDGGSDASRSSARDALDDELDEELADRDY